MDAVLFWSQMVDTAGTTFLSIVVAMMVAKEMIDKRRNDIMARNVSSPAGLNEAERDSFNTTIDGTP